MFLFSCVNKQESEEANEARRGKIICPITFFSTLHSAEHISEAICKYVDSESLRFWAAATRDARCFIRNLSRVDMEVEMRRKFKGTDQNNEIKR